MTSLVMSLAMVVTIPTSLVLALFARPLTELVVRPGTRPARSDGDADADDADHAGRVRRQRLRDQRPQLFQRFLAAALAPIMYNASIIAGALLFPSLGIEGWRSAWRSDRCSTC